MQFEINLHINKTQLEKYYTGIKTVTAKSIDGRRVQFPVNILHNFITHEGVHGVFLLEYDEQFKFKNISKLI
ncbi:MAG: DUF2835 family protein [Gammaproteobacteria bacterium]